MSDVSSALVRLLQWFTQTTGKTSERGVIVTGAKVFALQWLLDPVHSPFKTLTEIAQVAGVTKACISKSLLNLSDSIGLRISHGKGSNTRASYSRAQYRSLEARTHSSYKTRRRRS